MPKLGKVVGERWGRRQQEAVRILNKLAFGRGRTLTVTEVAARCGVREKQVVAWMKGATPRAEAMQRLRALATENGVKAAA